MNPKPLQVLNTLGFILVLVLNTLANALPLNGRTTGELSAMYPNLFVPAGFTFAIWGVIYLLLLGFVIFQFTKPAVQARVPQRIGIWFFLSCLFNASWILAWHYLLPELSLFIMLALLGSLIVIYRRVYATPAIDARGARWWVELPFSVYLGWITVATIANATAVLVHVGWDGWGIAPNAWAVIMADIAVIFGIWFTVRRSDIFYTLVIIWALVGIIARQQGGELGAAASLIANAWVGIALLLIFVVMKVVKRFRAKA